jgi:hypothetical protein
MLFEGHSLLEDIDREYSGLGKSETRILFTNIVEGKRPPSGPVDQEMAKADAVALREVGGLVYT